MSPSTVIHFQYYRGSRTPYLASYIKSTRCDGKSITPSHKLTNSDFQVVMFTCSISQMDSLTKCSGEYVLLISTKPSKAKRADPDGEYFGAKEQEPVQETRQFRRVRFAQDVPKIHSFDDGLSLEEYGTIWYTCEDYANFKHLAKEHGTSIMIGQNPNKKDQFSPKEIDSWGLLLGSGRPRGAHAEEKKDAKSWRDSMFAAYLAFRELQSDEEISVPSKRLSSSITMNEDTVGIIPYAMPEIMQDFVMLHQHTVKKLDAFQRATLEDGQDRSDMIRDQCRLTSQAARLFAQYICLLVETHSTSIRSSTIRDLALLMCWWTLRRAIHSQSFIKFGLMILHNFFSHYLRWRNRPLRSVGRSKAFPFIWYFGRNVFFPGEGELSQGGTVSLVTFTS